MNSLVYKFLRPSVTSRPAAHRHAQPRRLQRATLGRAAVRRRHVRFGPSDRVVQAGDGIEGNGLMACGHELVPGPSQ